MEVLILDEEQADELAALNASGSSDRRLETAALIDDRRFLNADLLTDCGEGQTWEHYGEFLGGLELAEIEEEDIAE